MHTEPHLTQEPVKMLFAHLYWTEGYIPSAFWPWTSHRLHIFHHCISKWHDLQQVSYDACLRFPTTACRGWDSVLAIQPVLEPLRASPFASSASAAHGPASLDSLFDVIGGLYHEV